MICKYVAFIEGGRGADTWAKEVAIQGEDMTIGQAVDLLEMDMEDAMLIGIQLVEAAEDYAMNIPEQFRWSTDKLGPYNSKEGDCFGMFVIPGRHANGRVLKVMADAGKESGWEHVSVSLMDHPTKCPSWIEMCKVKDLFWPKDQYVIQYHPPEDKYTNTHAGCLHLWRPTHCLLPAPPKICV